MFLASAFPKAIKQRREEAAKTRALSLQTSERIQQLATATLQTVLEEQDALERERSEDRALAKQRAEDLARRKTKLHWDAIRLTTYSESVSAQIDFQVQRRLNARAQEVAEDGSESSPSARAGVEADVKAEYAVQFVQGRLALANKTWERKERRMADKREAERRERAFRIRQEGQLAQSIKAESSQELAALQAEREHKATTQLRIPNFQLAVHGAFACEHRDVKSWGSKYDTGLRCKQCGKEMATSFDEPNHTRGADPALDADVQAQREYEAGTGPALQFATSAHLAAVESERVRLEKEARALQLTDAVLYDRNAPKAIDARNFRHGFDRGVALAVAGSDPLYARAVHDAHHAAFQDHVLFHGRLRNFSFRIRQLSELHAHVTTLLAVQVRTAVVAAPHKVVVVTLGVVVGIVCVIAARFSRERPCRECVRGREAPACRARPRAGSALSGRRRRCAGASRYYDEGADSSATRACGTWSIDECLIQLRTRF